MDNQAYIRDYGSLDEPPQDLVHSVTKETDTGNGPPVVNVEGAAKVRHSVLPQNKVYPTLMDGMDKPGDDNVFVDVHVEGATDGTAVGKVTWGTNGVPPSVTIRPATMEKQIKKGKDELDNESLLTNKPTDGDPRLLVRRSIFTQKLFDENYEPGSRPDPTFRESVKKKLSQCSCSGYCWRDFLFTVFPFIGIMKDYNLRQDITGDIVSGLTVGIMHIPQGMAYGMLTTLPPVYGLYTSFFPVLVYFFFGSSRHISVGTFAVACLMVGSAVSKGWDSHVAGKPALTLAVPTVTNVTTTVNTTLGAGVMEDSSGMPEEELRVRLAYAMSVAFVVGAIQLLMGFARLGFVTVYLSDPLVSGFTTGAACHVFTSQIIHVFGIKTKRYSGAFKLIYTYGDFFKAIPNTNAITLITAILAMVILYSVSRFINQNPKLKPRMFMPVPIELIVVVLGTLISYFVKLNEVYGVVIVDDIPTGLPMPAANQFEHITEVIGDSVALAIVIFAVSISMAKILAKRHEYEVVANQELVAFGVATMVSSFFASTPPSASLSRSLIQERVGGKTQVAGLVSCVLLLVVLLAIGPYFRTLPNCILAATIIVALEGLFVQVLELPDVWRQSQIDFCVLAAIIIVALRGMFLQVLDLKRLWKVSKIDFFVWIVAFLATVVLDVDLGLGVGVIFAVMTIVCRSQRPYVCVLGQIPGTDIYRDLEVYQEAKEIEGIKIFRFEHSLLFVNTEHFRTSIYKKIFNPRDLKLAQKKQEAKLKKLASQDKKNDVVKTPNLNGSVGMELEISGDDNKEVKVILDTRFTNISDIQTLVLDCSSWSIVDTMGVKVLSSVINEYKDVGVHVSLANCKGGIREMFEKTKFYDTVDRAQIYISVHDAVIHAQHKSTTASIKEDPSSVALEEQSGSHGDNSDS